MRFNFAGYFFELYFEWWFLVFYILVFISVVVNPDERNIGLNRIDKATAKIPKIEEDINLISRQTTEIISLLKK